MSKSLALRFLKEPWFGPVVAGCVGWMIVNNIPIVLGIFAHDTSFDEQALGLLASLEVLGMAFGVFTASWYVVLFRANTLVRILAITHVLSYLALVVSGTQYYSLAGCLFLVGFTGGGLISVALAAMGKFEDSVRALAIFGGVAQAISALYSPLLTYADKGFGLAGVWYSVAFTALLILPATWFGSQENLQANSGPAPTPLKEVFSDWTKFSVFVGILLFGLGIYMPYAFAERMGAANGIDLSTVGVALAIGTLISIPTSTWFGYVAHRFHYVTRLTIGAGIVAASAFVLAFTGHHALYTLAISGIQSGWSIIWIVCLGAMAVIDRSGRLIVLGYFVFKVSYAIAPVVAGTVAASSSYFVLTLFSGILLALACVLLSIAEYGARRPRAA